MTSVSSAGDNAMASSTTATKEMSAQRVAQNIDIARRSALTASLA